MALLLRRERGSTGSNRCRKVLSALHKPPHTSKNDSSQEETRNIDKGTQEKPFHDDTAGGHPPYQTDIKLLEARLVLNGSVEIFYSSYRPAMEETPFPNPTPGNKLI
ncbi:hypothetical protein OIU79_004439 [Salix purpurea]|uniref:Uncharacterized protein n=1 Tax=Salix purpurea TaxID=77065 RepID=A0A9Q0UA61_SALPP|nr:hypothetical protein OIU79_004439 [Salix purpurea]